MTLPAFRGDIINGYEFTPEARTPDPQRLLEAYHTSASTLNLIRAFTTGGFASLRRVHEWNRGFMRNPAYARYEEIAAEIDRAIRFMEACGADFDALRTVEFFASHEGLLLDYERPLTRIDSRTGLPYDCSAHFLWIGERTRQLDGAHVDFFSRVQTRSASSSARRRPATTRSRSSTSSTRAARPGASRSSRAWAPARSATCCPRSSRR